MATRILITIEGEEFHAELNDSATARGIVELLPMTVRMSRWGDEYYGSIETEFELEADARDIMKVGELAYWPSGQALCVFFGPTPASEGSAPVAASAVNPVGMVLDSCAPLKKMGSGVTAEITHA